MPDVLRVVPKSDILFPRAAPAGGFVGYQLATGDAQEGDHAIPNGPRYRCADEPEEVPNIAYYRRAIAREDIEQVHETPPPSEYVPEDDESEPSSSSEETDAHDAHESEG